MFSTLTALPIALVYRAAVHFFDGEFELAAGLRGSRLDHRDHRLRTREDHPVGPGRGARRRGTDGAPHRDARPRRVRAWRAEDDGLGRYDLALAAAQEGCEHDDPGFYRWSLSELIEAAVGCGQLDVARAAMHRFEERTVAAGGDWALGFLARARALVTDGDRADGFYLEAIERLERTPIVLHTGRTHLLYGEWLRRNGRHDDARTQSRRAEAILSRIGADTFAERARRELEALGEPVRRPVALPTDALSAQEAQIARLAADGLTNAAIGARLFISAHTVGFHLHEVYAKLGIRSRRQLGNVLS